MKFSEEVREHWSMKTSKTINRRMDLFKGKLRKVCRYIANGEFVTPLDKEIMEAARNKAYYVIDCGQIMPSGTKKHCHHPLLCEYCMNRRRAEINQCLKDYLATGKPLFCTVETGSYSFLRGVYSEGDEIITLSNASREVCENIDLSGKNEKVHVDIQDAFCDTQYFMTECQDKLIDWRAENRKRYQQRKSYLGGIFSLYHKAINIHTCSVESCNLFFWNKPPKEEVQPVKKTKIHSGVLYVTFREKRDVYNLTEELITKECKSGKWKNTGKDLFEFINSTVNVKFPWLMSMGSEELAYHLSSLRHVKTFQRIGKLFSGIND